jgi:crooked neck
MPENNRAWQAYAKLETDVGELGRARALFELAIAQPALDLPESMWKAFIDFEASLGEFSRGRALYERLLERTQHAKVFVARALFELEAGDGGVIAARSSFEAANARMKSLGLKEERVLLLNAWRDMEAGAGVEGDVPTVDALLPKKIKMRRAVGGADGEGLEGGEGRWEEYYEYSFPDDVKKMPGLNLLENAKKWKLMKAAGAAAGGAASAAGAAADGDAAADDDNALDIDDI